MRTFGTILPYARMVICPCDEDGNPAITDEEAPDARHECKALCLAWFGFAIMLPLGDLGPRTVYPDAPKAVYMGEAVEKVFPFTVQCVFYFVKYLEG